MPMRLTFASFPLLLAALAFVGGCDRVTGPNHDEPYKVTVTLTPDEGQAVCYSNYSGTDRNESWGRVLVTANVALGFQDSTLPSGTLVCDDSVEGRPVDFKLFAIIGNSTQFTDETDRLIVDEFCKYQIPARANFSAVKIRATINYPVGNVVVGERVYLCER
jgi:hypothetical protein